MNMAISSAPVSSGAAATGTASAASPVSGSGFEGLLVQAIVSGGGSNSNGTTSLPLNSGLIGLLGQSAAQPSGSQSQDLAALLNNLTERLQSLEQVEALPQDVLDQLAALLSAVQGLMAQLGQPIVTGPVKADPTAAANTNSVVIALQQSLQQLSKALPSNGDSADKASKLLGQLKSVLDQIGLQAADDHSVPLQPSVKQKDAAVSAAVQASSGSDNGVNVTSEASSETAPAAVVVSRRPVAAIADPVWRFNVVNGTESVVSDSQTAVVPGVSGSESTGSAGSQPAWTFVQNDSIATAESIQGKSGLPAQVPVQQFAQQMEKFLVKQFLLTQGNGTTEAKLTLTPEHLGQVDVRIVMQNGQLTAQFMTDNGMARDLLENQMAHLRSALHGQGLQVDRLEVVQQPSSSANTSFMQHDGRQPGSGGSGAGSRGKGGSYDDPALFETELERTSSLREFGYGSSLNVTA